MMKLLLVEDNRDNAQLFIRILETAGYEVTHTTRGLEGLKMARHQPYQEGLCGRCVPVTRLAFTLAPRLALAALSAYTIRAELEKRSVAQTETVADLIQQAAGRWIMTASDQVAATIGNPVTAQNAAF